MGRRPGQPATLYKFYGPQRVTFFGDFLVRFSQLDALNDPFEFSLNLTEGLLQKEVHRFTRRAMSPLSIVALAISQTYRTIFQDEKRRHLPLLVKLIALLILTPIMVVLSIVLYPLMRRWLMRFMLLAADAFEKIARIDVKQGLLLVFSCSSTWNSVPMWAHYAANHTGFVVGFDPEIAFPDRTFPSKPKAKPFLRSRPVIYKDNPAKVSRRNLDTLGDFTSSKLSHWSYEQEWRFTQTPDDADKVCFEDCGRPISLFRMNPLAIKDIIFGAKCARELVTETLAALSEAGIAPDIYQARIGAALGFERVRIHDPEDLITLQTFVGPPPSIRTMSFAGLDQAVSEMMDETRSHPVLRRLARLGENGRA